MKPVDQTVFGKAGNCMAACLASILEMDITDVPQPDGIVRYQDYARNINEWLSGFGIGMETSRFSIKSSPEVRRSILRGYCIVGVPSPSAPVEDQAGWFAKEWKHAVVAFDGHIVHDPYETRAKVSLPYPRDNAPEIAIDINGFPAAYGHRIFDAQPMSWIDYDRFIILDRHKYLVMSAMKGE